MGEFQNNYKDLKKDQLRIKAGCIHPAGSFTKFRLEDIEQSIPERFERQVAKEPYRLAVKTRNHRLSYLELNETANRVAHAILDSTGDDEASVLVLVENDAPAIAAILGVLKAGKTVIFLEPSHPHARLRQIFDDSQAHMIVTNSNNFILAEALAGGSMRLLNIDELSISLSTSNPGLSISPEKHSFIIYTSGSTGQPKGVIQNHRIMLHRVMNFTNNFRICSEDRQIFFTSPAYIAALWNILRSLLNGAAVFPYDVKKEGIGRLAEWLTKEEITIFSGLVIFRQFAKILTGQEDFSSVRLVTFGGDTIFKKDIENYKKHLAPHCILVLGLGTTETGRLTEYFIDKKTEIAGSIVPVGFPVRDMDVMLLDDTGSAAGFDRSGEIAVKSRYLSPGYWQRPDLTRAAFLPASDGGAERVYLTGDTGRMRPDGCLFLLGRKDFQVKVRGYSVQPVEVQTALLDLENIKEAVVVDEEDTLGEKRLIAYLVSDTHPAPSASHLRHELAQKLPDYMIPALFVILDALPVTPGGKIDRRALPKTDNSRPELENPFVPPQSYIEGKLSEIWSEVLNIKPVGILDKFLELGGNSLLGTRILSKVFNTFQVKFPLKSLFVAQTIAEMAVLIIKSRAEEVGQETLDQMLAELDALSNETAKAAVMQDEKHREKD